MNIAEDLYPSRANGWTNEDAVIIKRKDPVVYNGSRFQNPLSNELISRYKENGFLVLHNVFSEQEVESFQKELQRLRADPELCSLDERISEPQSGEMRSLFRVHHLSPLFSRLTADQRLCGLAQYILGDNVYIHQSRVNYKPGFRGREFYWHSDFETWHIEDGMPRMRALSMSILLTDNFSHNGPLMLMPGSHRDFVICPGDTPAEHFRQSLRKQEYGVPNDECLRQLMGRYGISVATGKPGSVIVFDCNIMHGSNSNITPLPRSNIFFVYNAMSNRVRAPYCNQPPRPEFVASRETIEALKPHKDNLLDVASSRTSSRPVAHV